MKSAPCDVCESHFKAETFEGWFAQMKEHYMADHSALMDEMMTNGTKEDGEKWQAEARARFEASENL
ncbi:MAG: hypothetical protein AAB802_03365 [Patescibacteria group bacterium]